MTRLFLCEKPSQARDIAPHVGARNRADGHMAGAGVVVTWCIGHLLELAPPQAYDEALSSWNLETLPIAPQQWRMEVCGSTKSQYAVVSRLLKQATEVVIATDADREGEVIAREVLDLAGYRGTIQRLWLSAFDAASIRKALGKLKPESATRSLYFSGLGRSRADWLAGMNFTRALTVAFGGRGREGVLTCGRVQTPVLGLIVRRERFIRNFVPKNFFVLDAQFRVNGSVIPMDWVMPDAVKDKDGHCVRAELVQQVADAVRGHAGVLGSVESSPGKEPAPLPYYLGSLQKEASARYGLKAKAVLDACQALYEKHKATTYPRTDCEHLPVSMFADVGDVLKALSQVDSGMATLVQQCRFDQPGRAFNDSKITAHHAIIPTANASVRMADMSKTERIVYDMIRRRYLAQFLGDHLFTKTVWVVECKGHRFTKTGKVTTTLGWKRVEQLEQGEAVRSNGAKVSRADAAEGFGQVREADAAVLPPAKAGDAAHNVKAEVVQRKTEPPKRYTEGTLISAMEAIDKEIEDPRFKQVMKSKEKAGIGTDATRPAIIEGLFDRQYIETQKKSLVPTDKGFQFIELLERIAPALVDPVLTAHWEERLMQIEAGQLALPAFEAEIKGWLAHMISEIKAQAGTTRIATPSKPAGKAQEASRARNATSGNALGATSPETVPKRSNAVAGNGPAAAAVAGVPAAGQTCPTCGKGALQSKTLRSNGKPYLGCSEYPSCKHFQWVNA